MLQESPALRGYTGPAVRPLVWLPVLFTAQWQTPSLAELFDTRVWPGNVILHLVLQALGALELWALMPDAVYCERKEQHREDGDEMHQEMLHGD